MSKSIWVTWKRSRRHRRGKINSNSSRIQYYSAKWIKILLINWRILLVEVILTILENSSASFLKFRYISPGFVSFRKVVEAIFWSGLQLADTSQLRLYHVLSNHSIFSLSLRDLTVICETKRKEKMQFARLTQIDN